MAFILVFPSNVTCNGSKLPETCTFVPSLSYLCILFTFVIFVRLCYSKKIIHVRTFRMSMMLVYVYGIFNLLSPNHHLTLNLGVECLEMARTLPKLPLPSTLWNTRWLRVRCIRGDSVGVGVGFTLSLALPFPLPAPIHTHTHTFVERE